MSIQNRALARLKKLIKIRVSDKEAQAYEWRVYGQFGEHYLPDNFEEEHIKALRRALIEAEEAGVEESQLHEASKYL